MFIESIVFQHVQKSKGIAPVAAQVTSQDHAEAVEGVESLAALARSLSPNSLS
jgi:hypothetical protein